MRISRLLTKRIWEGAIPLLEAREVAAGVTPPSMKRHGHPFPVTGDALKGACFPPILGWCRHDDSHFLRALGTKQRPGVSKDCLVRHILVHRHDEFPSRREKRRVRQV